MKSKSFVMTVLIIDGGGGDNNGIGSDDYGDEKRLKTN